MNNSVTRILSGWALTAVATMAAAAFVLYPFVADVAREASREEVLPSGSWYTFPLVALAFSATGFAVHRREPHLVGWLLHGVGLLWSGALLGGYLYALDASGWWTLNLAGRLLAVWLGLAWAPGVILMTTFLPLLFPTGRPPSPRWWWVAAIGAAALLFGFIVSTLDALARPLEEVFDEQTAGATATILYALMVAGALGGVSSVAVRYRRAGGIERRQLKWVAAALLLVGVVIGSALTPIGNEIGRSVTIQVALAGALCTIPISIGIAITRYRLYEIDRIISRTVSYGVLTVFLTAVYIVAVFGLQQTLRPVTGESELAVAGATLVVAAVFHPARRRVQRVVDRRFNRSQYDAQREVEAFHLRLRNEVDLDRIGTDLISVVRNTVDPAAVSLWLRPTLDRTNRQ